MLVQIPTASDSSTLRWVNTAHITTVTAWVDERPPGSFQAGLDLRVLPADFSLEVDLGTHPTVDAAQAAARKFVADYLLMG